MNCGPSEKQIHLFEELTISEREALLRHVSECGSCKQVFNSMTSMMRLVKSASQAQVEPVDSFQLTNRIMTAVKESRTTSLFNTISGFFDLNPVKWALTLTSLALIAGLALEQMEFEENTPVGLSANEEVVRLNASDFQQALKNHRASEDKTLLSGCYDPLRMTQPDPLCLRQKFAHIKTYKF